MYRQFNLNKNQSILAKYSGLLATTCMVGMAVANNPAKAAPTGGNVVGGNASITVSGTATHINQTSTRAAIDWQSFSVAANESVNFAVPPGGATLNRVVGNVSSLIQGSITSNGTLYLVNPNGLVFAVGSSVSAKNFIASTSNIDPTEFMRGDHITLGTSNTNARISLNGTITVADRGIVGIFAPQIVNEGIITANLGSIVLAGAQSSVIDFTGDGLINFELGTSQSRNGETLLSSNKGIITAAGGRVTLTAQGANELFNAVVENTGSINANSLTAQGGTVTLKANHGNIIDSGSIQASGTQGGGNVMVFADGNTNYTGSIHAEALAGDKKSDGGAVEVSGKQTIQFMGTVSTHSFNGGRLGVLLIDPSDITIQTSGPDSTAAGNIASNINTINGGIGATSILTVASLVAALAANNVVVDATAGGGTASGGGTITVANDITWSSTNSLTLQAGGEITIDGAITNSNGNLTLDSTLNSSTGDILLTKDITAATVTLKSGAGITGGTVASGSNIAATGSGLVNAATLNIAAKGEVSLSGSIAIISGLTQTAATSDVTIASSRALEVSGTLLNGSVTAGPPAVLSGNGKIDLFSSGAITIASGTGVIQASRIILTGTRVEINGSLTSTSLTSITANVTHVAGDATDATNSIVFNQGGANTSSITAASLMMDSGNFIFLNAGTITVTKAAVPRLLAGQNDGSINLTARYGEIDGSLATIKAASLTASATNVYTAADEYMGHGNGSGEVTLNNAANEIAALGAITGSTIDIATKLALTLNGNLTTSKRSTSATTNGTGTIKISTASGSNAANQAMSLGANVTVAATKTIFDLKGQTVVSGGAVTGGIFTTGATNKLTSAAGDVYLMAGGVSLSSTANAISIDVGTGTLHTATGDGAVTLASSQTLSNIFLNTHFPNLRLGYAFTPDNKSHLSGAYDFGTITVNVTGAGNNITIGSLSNNNLPIWFRLNTASGDVKLAATTVSLFGNLTINSGGKIDLIAANPSDPTLHGSLNMPSAAGYGKVDLTSVGDITDLGNSGFSINALTATSTTGNITLNPSPSSYATVISGDRIVEIGDISAKNITLSSSNSGFRLNGNLTANGENGAPGTILISTRRASVSNNNLYLGANVTANGRTTLDLGGVITIASPGNPTQTNINNGSYNNSGQFSTGTFTFSTNNNDVAIIAHSFAFGTPANGAKSINAGTAVVYTGSLGGNFTSDAAVTVDIAYMTNRFLYDYIGRALPTNMSNNVATHANITAANIVNHTQDITITAQTLSIGKLWQDPQPDPYQPGKFTANFIAHVNIAPHNINFVATGGSATSITVIDNPNVFGNLTLQATNGGVVMNAGLTVSNTAISGGTVVAGNGTLTITAGADVTSNFTVTANLLTATLKNAVGLSASLALTGLNKLSNLGAVTATSVSITNNQNLNLTGNLTTESLVATAPSNRFVTGGGTIYIATNSYNLTLANAITVNAILTQFDLGGVSGTGTGLFITGNNILSTTGRQDVAIVAKGITWGTGVLIDLHGGSLSSNAGGGTRNFTGDLVIEANFFALNGLVSKTGYVLQESDLAHVATGSYNSILAPVVINATGKITVDNVNFIDTNDVTLSGSSIVMGLPNSGKSNIFTNANLNLVANNGDIKINHVLTMGTSKILTLTSTGGGILGSTENSGSGMIIGSEEITVGTLIATATNAIGGGIARVLLSSPDNRIGKLGAITANSISIANSIDLVLMGDLTTSVKTQINSSTPIVTTTGTGMIEISTGGHNLSLGANVTLRGDTSVRPILFDLGGGGRGSFSNSSGESNYTLTATNQNLEIYGGGFNLTKPTAATYAIDLGTRGLLFTFDPGKIASVTRNAVYLGDGSFSSVGGLVGKFHLNTDINDNGHDSFTYEGNFAFKTQIAEGEFGPDFDLTNLRDGTGLSGESNLAAVNQASNAADLVAGQRTNRLTIVGDAYFDKFSLAANAPLTRDLVINVSGNVNFVTAAAANRIEVRGANLTITAGKSLFVNQAISLTGGALTLSAATGVTVNGAALAANPTGGGLGAINLHGGAGIVQINSPTGADYTLNDDVLTVTGALLQFNLNGTNAGTPRSGRLLGVGAGTRINSSALNTVFSGNATGNNINFAVVPATGNNSTVTFVKSYAAPAGNVVTIDNNFVLPPSATDTGINFVNGMNAPITGQSLGVGVKYPSHVAITINDMDAPSRGSTQAVTTFAAGAGNLTYIEGGSIKFTSATTKFSRQLVLQSTGTATKMRSGTAANPDIYANIYIGGALTTANGLFINASTAMAAVTPTRSGNVTSASNYGVIAMGALTSGGDLVINVNHSHLVNGIDVAGINAAGINGTAAAVALAVVTANTGNVVIFANSQVKSAGNAAANGVLLNGAVKTGKDVIISQSGNVIAPAIGAATAVNVTQAVTTGGNSGSLIISTSSGASVISGSASAYGIQIGAATLGGYLKLTNEAAVKANALGLSVAVVAADGIVLNAGKITAYSLDSGSMLGLSLVNTGDITLVNNLLTPGSQAVGIYAVAASVINITAGGLSFDNEGAIISSQTESRQIAGINDNSAYGIYLGGNLSSVIGQDINLTNGASEVTVQISGQAAGIYVGGTINAGDDFNVTQNAAVTSSYKGNATGYQQVGSVTAARNVTINQTGAISTNRGLYAFGTVAGINIGGSVTTTNGNAIINNTGNIYSSGIGALGVQVNTINSGGGVALNNSGQLTLMPSSSNSTAVVSGGIALNGAITAQQNISIYNAAVGESVLTATPGNISAAVAGIGSPNATVKNPSSIKSTFGSITIINQANLRLTSTTGTVGKARGIDLYANITTLSANDITLTNGAAILNNNGNGDAAGIYLQGMLTSGRDIIVTNQSQAESSAGIKSTIGSAYGVVVGGLKSAGATNLSNQARVYANDFVSALASVTAYGVGVMGAANIGGRLTINNTNLVRAQTLGVASASYFAAGIAITATAPVVAGTVDFNNSGNVSANYTTQNSIYNIKAVAYGIDIASTITTKSGDTQPSQGNPFKPSLNLTSNVTGENPLIVAYGTAAGINIAAALNSAGQIYVSVAASVSDGAATNDKGNLPTGSAVGINAVAPLTAIGGVSLLLNTGLANAGNSVSSLHGSATGIYVSKGIKSSDGGVTIQSVGQVSGQTTASGVSLLPNFIASYNPKTRRTTNTPAPAIAAFGNIVIGQNGSVTAETGAASGITADAMTTTNGGVSLTQIGPVTAATGSASGMTAEAITASNGGVSVTQNGVVTANQSLANLSVVAYGVKINGNVTGGSLIGNGVTISNGGNVIANRLAATDQNLINAAEALAAALKKATEATTYSNSNKTIKIGRITYNLKTQAKAAYNAYLAANPPPNPAPEFTGTDSDQAATILSYFSYYGSTVTANGIALSGSTTSASVSLTQGGNVTGASGATAVNLAGAVVALAGGVTVTQGGNISSASGTAIGLNQTGSVTAAGALSLSNSGNINSSGDKNATALITNGLSSFQDIRLTQSGMVNHNGTGTATGIRLTGKVLAGGNLIVTHGGAVNVATAGKAIAVALAGANAQAYNDLTVTISGTVQNGSFDAAGVFTAAAAANQSTTNNLALHVATASTLSGSAAGYSWVTLRSNNLNLQLDSQLTVNKAEIRVDLNSTSNGTGTIAGSNQIVALGLNLYYTGVAPSAETGVAYGTSGAKFAINLGINVKTTTTVTTPGKPTKTSEATAFSASDSVTAVKPTSVTKGGIKTATTSSVVAGGGNFFMVQNVDGLANSTPTLLAAPPAAQVLPALPGWVNAGGNSTNNDNKQYIGYSSRNAVTVTGATNTLYSFVEGTTITVAAGTSFSKNVTFNTIGGAGASGGFNLNGNLTTNGAVSIFTHGGNFAMSAAAVIASSTTARTANTSADTAPILVNLGGNNNGGSFSNGGFTLNTSNHDLTVLAGAWNLTSPNNPPANFKAIELGGATGGNFSVGGLTLSGHQTFSATSNLYQGGADVSTTLINAAKTQDSNITVDGGNITINGVFGLNLGTAKIIAKTGSITVSGASSFGSAVSLETSAAGQAIFLNAALNLATFDLTLNSGGAIIEAGGGAIIARNLTILNAGINEPSKLTSDGTINLGGANAINTIVSIKQLGVRSVTTTPKATAANRNPTPVTKYYGNGLTINNTLSLTVGTITRIDGAGVTVTTNSDILPASDVKITTTGAYSNLTLNNAAGSIGNLTLAASGNLTVNGDQTSAAGISLSAGGSITAGGKLTAATTAAGRLTATAQSGAVNLTGVVTANNVSASAGGAVTINNVGNQITNFGAISGVSFDIGSAIEFTLTGNLTATASSGGTMKISNYGADMKIIIAKVKNGLNASGQDLSFGFNGTGQFGGDGTLNYYKAGATGSPFKLNVPSLNSAFPLTPGTPKTVPGGSGVTLSRN